MQPKTGWGFSVLPHGASWLWSTKVKWYVVSHDPDRNLNCMFQGVCTIWRGPNNQWENLHWNIFLFQEHSCTSKSVHSELALIRHTHGSCEWCTLKKQTHACYVCCWFCWWQLPKFIKDICISNVMKRREILLASDVTRAPKSQPAPRGLTAHVSMSSGSLHIKSQKGPSWGISHCLSITLICTKSMLSNVRP